MPLTAKVTGGASIPPLSEGVHIGVCYEVIDLGTQHFEVGDKGSRKVLIGWEVPGERVTIKDKDLPHTVASRYTLSLHEKAALRKVLESWRGRAFTEGELEGFDLHKLLGKACQLQVVHKTSGERVYANVAAIMALPRGVKAPPTELAQVFFSFEDIDKADPRLPPAHERLLEVIKQSDEWQAIEQEGLPSSDLPDEPPTAEDATDNGTPF